MTTKQMMDIFYKGPLGPFGPLDLCSLEKYMLTHTFFDGFKETDQIIPVSKPILVEQIIPVLQESIKTEQIIPVSKPILVEQIIPVLQESIKTEPIIPVSKPILVEQLKPPAKTRFCSYLKDSLFWCMYVHSHGYAVFETHKAIGTNMLNLMMNEKRLLSDFFNKEDNKTALKNTNHKITNVKINEIKCNLMTKPMLSSIEALIPCCVYWNCPIYVDLGNKTFLHFVPNTYVSDEDESANEGPEDPKVPKVTFIDAVLLYICEGRFELELDAEKKSHRIKEICQRHYKIPHYEKPLLGIGTYKTDEMQHLYDMVIGASDVVCCTKTKGAEHPTLPKSSKGAQHPTLLQSSKGAQHPTLLQSSKGAEHPTLPKSSKMKKQEMYAAIAQKCVLPTTMF